jgi:hypothetical protein
MHRKIAKAVGAVYTTERSEAYTGNLASENDALMLDNTNLWKKNAEYADIGWSDS